MLRAVIFALCLLAAVESGAAQTLLRGNLATVFPPPNFTTTFPLTESPMSQGGEWVQGCVTGVDWGCIQTFGGLASGSGPPSTYPTNLTDSTAVLTGSWSNNQQAKGTVYVGTFSGHDWEVELRLRTTITAHSITGYEFDCSVATVTGSQYVGIARWNGALNDFTSIGTNTPNAYCQNGDVITATADGSLLTMYINNVIVAQATDSTYSGGSPGVGAYTTVDATHWNQLGFTSFSAWSIP